MYTQTQIGIHRAHRTRCRNRQPRPQQKEGGGGGGGFDVTGDVTIADGGKCSKTKRRDAPGWEAWIGSSIPGGGHMP